METIKLNINLTVNELMNAVKQLSPKDKLKINDAIWSGHMEIPFEHQKIVMDRISTSKANPERLLDWEEVSKKL